MTTGITLGNDMTDRISRTMHSHNKIANTQADSLSTGQNKLVDGADRFIGNALQDNSKILAVIKQNASYTINMLAVANEYIEKISSSVQEGLRTIGSVGPLSHDKLVVFQKNLEANKQHIEHMIQTADFDGKKLLSGDMKNIEVQLNVEGCTEMISCEKMIIRVSDLSLGKLFRSSATNAINDWIAGNVNRTSAHSDHAEFADAVASRVNFVQEVGLTNTEIAAAIVGARADHHDSINQLSNHIADLSNGLVQAIIRSFNSSIESNGTISANVHAADITNTAKTVFSNGMHSRDDFDVIKDAVYHAVRASVYYGDSAAADAALAASVAAANARNAAQVAKDDAQTVLNTRETELTIATDQKTVAQNELNDKTALLVAAIDARDNPDPESDTAALESAVTDATIARDNAQAVFDAKDQSVTDATAARNVAQSNFNIKNQIFIDATNAANAASAAAAAAAADHVDHADDILAANVVRSLLDNVLDHSGLSLGDAAAAHIADALSNRTDIKTSMLSHLVDNHVTNLTTDAKRAVAKDVFGAALHTLRNLQSSVKDQQTNLNSMSEALHTKMDMVKKASDAYLKTDYIEAAQDLSEQIRMVSASVNVIQMLNKRPEIIQRFLETIAR